MPAVNLTRLRFQIQSLLSFFQTPSVFHRRLTDLFSMSANRVLRFGETTQTVPLIPTYHLPHPIIRQLHLDLKPLIDDDPTAALLLADELWTDKYFEVKQTAIFILGNTPTSDPEPVLSRLKKWLKPGLDAIITSYLLSTGTHTLQASFPEVWEGLINDLLTQKDPKMTALGIQGLSEGLKTSGFKNLPAVFRLVSPFIREPDDAHLKELEHLIEVLIDQSPSETAYFLKQALSISSTPKTRRLIKQCLPFFPENIQKDLKSALKV